MIRAFIIGISAALIAAAPARAACGVDEGVDIDSGQAIEMQVCANVMQTFDPEICVNEPAAPGCEMIVSSLAEPKHFCEGAPERPGCRYYQGDQGEK